MYVLFGNKIQATLKEDWTNTDYIYQAYKNLKLWLAQKDFLRNLNIENLNEKVD